MNNHRRSIFRESAMREYAQKREKDILPYTIAPPVFAYCWLMLALLLLLAVLTWSIEFPTYVTAPGTVLQAGTQKNSEAVIFFPSSNAARLHVGTPIQVQIGKGPRVHSSVARIDAPSISPDEARKRYALDNSTAQGLNGPTVAIIVQLSSSVPARSFAGSPVSGQLQTSTRSVISQFF
ncbi:MAG: hypothetical protein J2P37_17710 [Ktedonobacteraceae bacterium]|nr:hypothetical protein [Ktedonobacteraceae bacterium]